MFERVFQLPKVLARHRDGPMAEERDRFLTHLADHGVGRLALRLHSRYLLAGAKRLRLADRPHEKIARNEVEQEGVRWARRSRKGFKRKGGNSARKCFVRCVTKWLQFMDRLQPRRTAPHRFAEEIAAFAEHMQIEKSLAPQTIRSELSRLEQICDRLGNKSRGLKDITITQIDKTFIEQSMQGGYARTTLSTLAYTLRVFF